VHIVTAELDDGAVLGQTEVAILAGDTADDMAARVLIAEHQLYSRILADFVSREAAPEWVLTQIRERAMAQPEAEETLSHGMPCFGITGGKKFAYFTRDHHGDGKTAILVKISGLEEQAMLIGNDPDRYYRPAYFGDGWIAIRLDLGDNDWDHIAEWLRKSWIAVASPKLRKVHALADEF
jgi:phosphoribosylglycinamide formyltransferase 1